MEEKRRPGRPRKYAEDVANDGAPVLRVRLEPDVYLHVQAQPEGARAYLERVVRADRDQAAGASAGGQGKKAMRSARAGEAE